MKEWLVSAALAVIAIFAPAKQLFIATGVLIAADLITGLMAAHKLKQPITSAGLRRTVSKTLIYNLAVACGYLVQTHMMGDLVPVSNIISSAIGLTELKSVIENIDKIRGGSLFKDILLKLGSANDTTPPPKDSARADNKPQSDA